MSTTTNISTYMTDTNKYVSDILSNVNFVKVDFTKLDSIILVSVAAIIVILSVFFTLKVTSGDLFNANNEQSSIEYNQENTSEKSAELFLFYVEWCPHCKSAKPTWDEFKDHNKTVNGYSIIYNEINCTDENEQSTKLINKYNIEGFPTIILLKNNEVIQFDAKPSKETISQFLTTTL
tara:strand:- start:1664 stop:2197 length:534 start_codon:yes stop_codon:yes gene_type:complete